MEDIRFDDIAALKSKISDTFGDWSDPLEVTQDMINRFAELTGDHQWIHVDVERAKRESPFGGTIAHGFLTLSLLPAMRSKAAWKVVGYGNATNYGANKLRFVSPVPAGAKVHSHGRLIGVETASQGDADDAGDRGPRRRQRSARAALRDGRALPPGGEARLSGSSDRRRTEPPGRSGRHVSPDRGERRGLPAHRLAAE